ncbi:pimeloyl-ACP methyl ester esterase BioH [Ferrimonas balearica]|uniref:pimeloyl-ACP methyl ester esterase BioH n=1 Tax=Ferrimonas balearica TaxID=44012 RepID=UPI001C994CD5|nr:pimeloyl-ACP methyl ester esterase BioH [Ferrimonas balearica]MBY5994026.1 pimeloyl-ACP methyl ester esterase BioH [Ferrimonas balearica]
MSIASSLAKPGLHIQWQGSGEPLLLLHGWGMNGAVWQGLAPQLADLGFRVGAVDLPGFGASPALGSGDRLEPWVDALLASCDGPVHLLGWSLGGLVAQKAALLAPQRVRSLVTLASSPCFQARDGWRGIPPEVLSQFAEQLATDLPRTLERFFALQAMGSPSAKADVRALRQAVSGRPAPDPRALAGGLTLLAEVDLRVELAEIACPWLRLYGRLDGLVPARGVTAVDRLAPQSRSLVLTKAAHAPFISHPAETGEVLKAFYLSL